MSAITEGMLPMASSHCQLAFAQHSMSVAPEVPAEVHIQVRCCCAVANFLLIRNFPSETHSGHCSGCQRVQRNEFSTHGGFSAYSQVAELRTRLATSQASAEAAEAVYANALAAYAVEAAVVVPPPVDGTTAANDNFMAASDDHRQKMIEASANVAACHASRARSTDLASSLEEQLAVAEGHVQPGAVRHLFR